MAGIPLPPTPAVNLLRAASSLTSAGFPVQLWLSHRTIHGLGTAKGPSLHVECGMSFQGVGGR